MIYEITAFYRDILPDHPKHAGKHSVHLTIKPGRLGRWLGKREQHVELLGSPAAGWLEIAKSIFQPMKPWKGDSRKLARLVRAKLDAERAIDRQAVKRSALAVGYGHAMSDQIKQFKSIVERKQKPMNLDSHYARITNATHRVLWEEFLRVVGLHTDEGDYKGDVPAGSNPALLVPMLEDVKSTGNLPAIEYVRNGTGGAWIASMFKPRVDRTPVLKFADESADWAALRMWVFWAVMNKEQDVDSRVLDVVHGLTAKPTVDKGDSTDEHRA